MKTLRRILILFFAALMAACSDDKPEVEVSYSFTAVASPQEGGSVSPQQGSYAAGATVTVRATPNADYTFTGWSGAATGDSNPLTLTVAGNTTLTANFKLREYPLSLEVEGGGTVKETVVSTRTDYAVGTVVELTAVPDEGWTFSRWEGDVSSTENPLTITVNAAVKLKAVFVEEDPGIKFTETEYMSPQDVADWLGLGVNLAESFECVDDETFFQDETLWGNGKVTQETFNKYKAAGIKSVRIPITWLSKVGPAPDYIIEEDYLNRIAEVVGYAENVGINAIINIHHDAENGENLGKWLDLGKAISDDNADMQIKNQLTAMWKQISRKFGDKGDFLIFEGFNELTDAWDSPSDWGHPDLGKKRVFDCYQDWCQTFVDAVRSTGKSNADRWLMIPSICASADVALARYDLPKDYVSNNRFIFSFHQYDPGDFTGAKVGEWGHTAMITTPETANYVEEDVVKLFSKLKTKFYDNGIPICISEIGCSNRSNDWFLKFQLYWYEFVCKAARTYGMAPVIWDDGKEGERHCGIFDRATGDFIDNGEKVMDVLNRAIYDNDPNYTLQTVYDKAPPRNAMEETEVEIEDAQFKKYILEIYDYNNDGILSKFEAYRIDSIDVNTDNIRSLKGIENFGNLHYLHCCGSVDYEADRGLGLLTSIDVSGFPYLVDFAFDNNQIEEIDLSNNIKLKQLYCRYNRLTEIDLSKNPKLNDLDLTHNYIESVDLSNNPKLNYLRVNNNHLSSLNTCGMNDLKILEIDDTEITSINIENNIKLEALHHGGIGVGDIDIDYSLFPNLKRLVVGVRSKPTLDVSGATRLEYLGCPWSQIETLDVSNNSNLKELRLEGDYQLKELWLKKGQQIETIVKEEQVVIKYK